MSLQLIGETCALLTACTWAFALVLFKRSTNHIPPLPLNIFKNVVGIMLLITTLALGGGGAVSILDFPIEDVYILVLSGVIGIAIADTLFLKALDLVGVGIISIVDCLYSPLVILFAILMLGEKMTPSLIIGASLVLAGVLVSSRHTPPPDRTKSQLIGGILLGAFTMVLMAFGIVVAKPVLEGNDYPLIWATTIRLVGGTIALALIAVASPARRRIWGVFRPAPVWKSSLPASVLGTYVAMILWMAGFKYASASVVSILNQMSVVFAMLLATWMLKERFTKRKLVSLLLALAGALIVTNGETLANLIGLG